MNHSIAQGIDRRTILHIGGLAQRSSARCLEVTANFDKSIPTPTRRNDDGAVFRKAFSYCEPDSGSGTNHDSDAISNIEAIAHV
jgi:hypothetical protein